MAPTPSSPDTDAPKAATSGLDSLSPGEKLKVRDLAQSVALHAGTGGLFLVGVDSEATCLAAEHAVIEALPSKAFCFVFSASPTAPDPLAEAANFAKQHAAGPGARLASIKALDPGLVDAPAVFLRRLNTRRELVPLNNLLVVMWLAQPLYERIQADAKDFWAFRTATYSLAARPPLAEREPIPEEAAKQISELREQLEKATAAEPKKHPLIASIAFRLGELCFERSLNAQALKAFLVAEASFSASDDKHNRAAALGNIGIIYSDKGDLDQALRYLQQALEIDREIGYQQGVASDLGNIGLIYSDKGDLDHALRYLRQALEIFTEIGSTAEATTAQRNIQNIQKSANVGE